MNLGLSWRVFLLGLDQDDNPKGRDNTDKNIYVDE